jgi:hypothetical protein
VVIARISATQLIVYPSQNIASITYRIWYNGDQAAEGSHSVANILQSLSAALIGGGFTYYQTGNSSQSGTAITGTGTTYLAAMEGGLLIWPTNPPTVAYINNYISATSLTSVQSQTVAASPAVVVYGGHQVFNGNLAIPGTMIMGTPAFGATNGLNNYVFWTPVGATNATGIAMLEWQLTSAINSASGIPIAQVGEYRAHPGTNTETGLTLNHGMSVDSNGLYWAIDSSLGGMQQTFVDGKIEFNAAPGGLVFQEQVTSIITYFSVQGSPGDVFIGKAVCDQEPAKSMVYLDANKGITGVAATNGQILIGSTGAVPVAALPLGTANQIVVTGGAGSLTFKLADTITVVTGIRFPANGGTVTTLNNYEEGSVSATPSYTDVAHCTGLPGSTNVSFVKNGNIVSIRFHSTTCTAGASATGGTFTLAGIPTRLNPITSGFINFPFTVENNGAATAGLVQFLGSGPTWTVFGTTAGGNFGTTNGQIQGWNGDIVLTYPTI